MIQLKRSFLLFLLLLATLNFAFADAIDDFAASRGVNANKTALLVVDLKSGKELLSFHSSLPLIPASIMKSVTTATLLEEVGPNYKYNTPVYMLGRLNGDVLDGNLLVEASGDPSINTVYEPHTADFVAEIVDALKMKSVKKITGSIEIDESRFPGYVINPGWSQGDLKYAYGTGSHGFNFEDNASGRSAVRNPSNVFISRLKQTLRNEGISISDTLVNARGEKHILGEHHSATIDEIMRSCMMRSDNQFAESMLRLVGDKLGKNGSTVEGVAKMTDFWKRRRVNMEGVKICDGSGLSRSNRVTARFMADMLKSMADNPYYASFFPLAGMEGTLKKFLADTPLEGYLAMKTGSMRGIQCYAGYKLDEDYAPTHIVVAIMNDMTDGAAARSALSKLLLATFGESATI